MGAEVLSVEAGYEGDERAAEGAGLKVSVEASQGTTLYLEKTYPTR